MPPFPLQEWTKEVEKNHAFFPLQKLKNNKFSTKCKSNPEKKNRKPPSPSIRTKVDRWPLKTQPTLKRE